MRRRYAYTLFEQKRDRSQNRQYGKEMRQAAKEWRFEDAAKLRDQLQHYQKTRLLEEEL